MLIVADLSGFATYIDTFESALSETLRLHASIEERVATQTRSLTLHHGELHQKSVQLGTAFERAFQSFSSLERRFDQMEGHAVRAGLALEKLHQEQRRAQEALQIVQLFTEFVGGGVGVGGGSISKLQAMLFHEGGSISTAASKMGSSNSLGLSSSALEQRRNAVRTLKRLLIIAKTDIPGTERGRGQIEQMAERLENALLTAFHEAFEQGNTDGMRDAASLLVTFNGGHSCVQSFVSQHAFFIEPVHPETIQSRYHPDTNNGIPVFIDLNVEEPLDPVLETLFSQIGQTAEADWKYLSLVFTRPSRVMDRLQTRIFHEPMQVHLEELLRQALSHSQLAYLRSLKAAYEATKRLCDTILAGYEQHQKGKDGSDKTLFLSNDQQTPHEAAGDSTSDDEEDEGDDVGVGESSHSPSSSNDHQEASPEEGRRLRGLKGAARLIKELLRHLYSPYLDTDTYASTETTCLSSLLTIAACPLQAYCRGQASRVAARGNLFSGITAAVTGSGGSDLATPTPADQLVMATLYRFGPDQRPLVTGEEGNLGVPSRTVIERCLVLFGEALIRVSTLPPPPKR